MKEIPWIFIEPDLSIRQNLQLRFWFIGMDLFNALPRRWGWRPYLFCVEKAGDLSYGEPPRAQRHKQARRAVERL